MKIPQDVLIEIKAYAEKIGSVIQHEQTGEEPRLITGEDLLLCNMKEVEGKPIEKQRMYTIAIPVYHFVNYEERMKDAYKRLGRKGIYEYLKTLVEPEYYESLHKQILG